MHTILTDYGRKTVEITDAEYLRPHAALLFLPHRHLIHWTDAMRERDMVWREHHWRQRESLALAAWTEADDANAAYAMVSRCHLSNRAEEEECRLRSHRSLLT